MTTSQSTSRHLAHAAGACTFLLFAGQFIVSRHGVLVGLTFHDITALRFAVAGIISLPFMLAWGIDDLAGIGWRRGILLAGTGGAPYFLLILGGLTYAPAAHAVAIGPGMTLIFGTALSALWLREPVSARRVGAGIICVGGLALMSWESVGAHTNDVWIGDVLFVVSALSFALYIAFLSRWKLDPVRAAMAVAFLSMLYLPVYLQFLYTGETNISASNILLQAVYHGLIHGLVATALLAFASRGLGAGRVSLMTPIAPVAGLVMAVILLDEQISTLQWCGATAICLGMVLGTFQQRQKVNRADEVQVRGEDRI